MWLCLSKEEEEALMKNSGFSSAQMNPQNVNGNPGGWPATCLSCDCEYSEKRVGVIRARGDNAYGICPECAHAISVFKTFLVKENGAA